LPYLSYFLFDHHIVIVVVFKEKVCVHVDVFIDVSITVWMSQISQLLRVKVGVPSAKAYWIQTHIESFPIPCLYVLWLILMLILWDWCWMLN